MVALLGSLGAPFTATLSGGEWPPGTVVCYPFPQWVDRELGAKRFAKVRPPKSLRPADLKEWAKTEAKGLSELQLLEYLGYLSLRNKISSVVVSSKTSHGFFCINEKVSVVPVGITYGHFNPGAEVFVPHIDERYRLPRLRYKVTFSATPDYYDNSGKVPKMVALVSLKLNIRVEDLHASNPAGGFSSITTGSMTRVMLTKDSSTPVEVDFPAWAERDLLTAARPKQHLS
jgi:hypothetical protein